MRQGGAPSDNKPTGVEQSQQPPDRPIDFKSSRKIQPVLAAGLLTLPAQSKRRLKHCRRQALVTAECSQTRSLSHRLSSVFHMMYNYNGRGGLQADQDEHQGRCKCGKRISAAHPPCKSELMLLCEKFQQRYCQMGPNGASTPILLNDVAGDLGVPRRRLYDIINVMEAVEIVHRIGKLAYEWRGTAHLPALLEQLLQDEEQGRPVEDRVRKSGQHAKQAATAAQHAAATLQNQASIGSQEEGRQTSNSLWVLSRKFVRLLLANPGPVPLTEAAALLAGHDSGDPRRQQMLITIERRLIDIGCILSCVDLIEKTYLGKRQPAFTWNWRWQRSGSLSSIGSSITCFMLAKEESSPCADLAAHGGETIGTGPGLDPSDVAQELPLPWPFGLQLHHASLAMTLQLMQQRGQLGLPSLAAIKGLNLLPGADAGAGAAGPGLPPGLLASLMLGTGLSTMPGVPLQSSEHSVRSQAAAHSTVQPHSVTVTSAVQQAAE
ncbi:hypothetical protein WJX72_003635 [[Myrmecia] bisecta]|uniref:E2F/DP family winged-helix DNA-binding domain-containing protein n=1 Tax=[Myrmecia] bisecta TaxID=41462 RepID=A0AAW1PCZ0_9CHLO